MFGGVVDELLSTGEGDQGYPGVTPELCEAVADRDGMSDTGQSMDVAMEDQYDGATSLCVEAPRFTLRIDHIDRRGTFAQDRPGCWTHD